jgi:ABC-type transport system substrate-binding protein
MRSIRARLEALPSVLAAAGAALLVVPLGCDGALRAPIPAAHGDDEAPRRGGVLRLATVYDLRSLDPAAAPDGLAGHVFPLLFDGLVELDRDGQVVPDLAERWEVEDGGKLYRFVLRPGVTMHDGAELTADDVKRSVERALHSSTPSSVSAYLDDIVGYAAYTSGKAEHLEGVAVEGRYVVTFRLTQPDAAFLSLLAVPAMRPVCASAGDRFKRGWLPCGAGPFRLEPDGWQRGTSLRVVRHESYFRPGLPHLDAVEWALAMPQVPQRFRFEDGQLDMLMDPVQADYARFAADPRWRDMGVPLSENITWGEAMNTRLPPFDNVEVRRAVAAAIDREQFRKIKPANMSVSAQLLPTSMPGYDPSWACQPHDETAALEHMRKAGYPFDPATGAGGWPHPIAYTVADGSANFYVAQIVQQQLARIGIRIELRVMNLPAYWAVAERQGGTQMAPWGNGADYADPSSFFDSLFTTAGISPEQSNNVSFYSNPRYDGLVARARHEMDPAARQALYRQAHEILCDEAPWAFTWAQRDFVIRQPYVKGFSAHRVLPFDARGVWLDRGDSALEHILGGGLR